MSNNLRQQVAILRRDERGQIAIVMVLILPVVFMLFALALDAGVWFLDHRLAQNQVDAAALAAMQFLPAEEFSENHIKAEDAVKLWLEKNGSGLGELCKPDANGPYPQFSDLHPSGGDGRIDAVRVCVRRQSPGIFSRLADIEFIYVSAVAGARVAPSNLANVKPWAIAPRNPDCRFPGMLCFHDPNDMYDPYDINDSNDNWDVADVNWNGPDGNLGDGITAEPDGDLEPCGYYPPLPGVTALTPLGDQLCPWGLHEDQLQVFKVGEGASFTPGNFAPITACGSQGATIYRDCINGGVSSGFYKVGDTVHVNIETGNMVGPTMQGLEGSNKAEGLYENEPSGGIYGSKMVWQGDLFKAEDIYKCDVHATPHPVTGMDADGKDRADATYARGRELLNAWDPLTATLKDFDYISGCEYRLVSIVVIDEFPAGGSGNAEVMGVATYAIAGWDRTNPNDPAIGNHDYGEICGQSLSVGYGGLGGYYCGQVWGYFMQEVRPPEVLLQISDSDNPFAPVFIALVE